MNPRDTDLARLEMNARHFQYDAALEHAVELFHNDRPAFERLPNQLRSQVGIYQDFRQSYRDAVAAGAIKADHRGSAA